MKSLEQATVDHGPPEITRGAAATLAHTRRVPARSTVRSRIHAIKELPAVLSIGVLSFFLASALFPQLMTHWLPTNMAANSILLPPGGAHWFGTDQFGRDVYSLVVYGARQSMLIAGFSVLIGCGGGSLLGIIAGYAGGWIDKIAMRLVDIWLAIPSVLLALAIATALPPSRRNLIIAVGFTLIPRQARILRGQALAVRSRPFIEAARAAGASHWAILRGHVLPHCFAQIFVLATINIALSILIAATLTCLGLGQHDDRPDWGYLLSQSRSYLGIAWWSVTFPGLAITTLVISVNLLGDALQRRLDPRRATAR
jgi:peptide/nickel transport system permease protein